MMIKEKNKRKSLFEKINENTLLCEWIIGFILAVIFIVISEIFFI